MMEGEGDQGDMTHSLFVSFKCFMCQYVPFPLCLLDKPEWPIPECESHKEASGCKCNQSNVSVMGSAENFTGS